MWGNVGMFRLNWNDQLSSQWRNIDLTMSDVRAISKKML